MATDMGNGIMAPDTVDGISPSGVAEMRAIAAGASTAIDAAKWKKGRLPNGTNVNTFTDPGIWVIPSQTAADSMIGLAEKYPSILVVTGDPAGSTIIHEQLQIVHLRGRTYSRVSGGNTGGGPFFAWSDRGVDLGRVSAGFDFDTLGEGRAAVAAPTNTAVLNLPAGAGPGFCIGYQPFSFQIMRAQMYFEYGGIGGNGRVWARASAGTTTWAPWREITSTSGGGGNVNYAVENPFANDQRKQWFIRRRGGYIGTGKLGAVAIRLDHGAGNLRDLVLDDLVSRSLPWGMAINPSPERIGIPENAGITWTTYREWARCKGMEPWNHSLTHGQALDTASWVSEIIGGRDLLQESMPESAIEGWMVPGVGTNGYGGQSSTNKIDSFFGYEAGRIIMSSHAVSSGYGGGDVRPQVGALVDGQDHFGLDGAITSAETISVIQQAQDTGGTVQLFLHPSQIGLADMTTVTVLRQIWDFLAAERDAGRLLILSPSGLLLADPSKDTRHNLVRFGAFANRNGRDWTSAWLDRTGWAVSGSTVTTTTGGVLRQVIPENTLKHCRGALYEIVAEVSSTSGAVARIGSSTLAGALKDVTITAGQTRVIRQLVTLPLNSSADFNVSVGRVSGGDLTVSNVALQPV